MPDATEHADRPDPRVLVALGVVLALAAAMFIGRGPMRALSGGADLAHVYAAAAVWVDGGDPYDGALCAEALAAAGHGDPDHVESGSLYPPSTFPVMAWLTAMDWPTARLAWAGVNLLAVGVLIGALFVMMPGRSPAVLLMAAAAIVLGFAPVHTSLALGQISLVVAAAVVAGLVLVVSQGTGVRDQRSGTDPTNRKTGEQESRRAGEQEMGKGLIAGAQVLSGLLVGVAAALKPQVGLGFVVLLGLLGCWRALGWSVGVVALMGAVGVGRLWVAGVEWWGPFQANLARFSEPGAIGDARPGGPFRYQMIDLRPVLYVVFSEPRWVAAAAWGLVLAAAGVAIWRLRAIGLRRHALLAAGGVAVLTLMPTYHRFYDAAVLLVAAVWVVGRLTKNRSEAVGWVAAAALAPFLVPGSAALATLVQRGTIPDSIAGTWLWTHVMMQHQSWCLVILLGCLLVALFREPRTG